MEIGIKRAQQKDAIEKVVYLLFHDIVEDGTQLSVLDDYVDVERDCWLEIKFGGELLGFVQFSPYNRSVLEIHPFILKSMRKNSHKAIFAAIEWIEAYAPDMYRSFMTKVPSCKRYATVFAHRMGFHEAGRFAEAFCCDGEYHDIVLFQRKRLTWAG